MWKRCICYTKIRRSRLNTAMVWNLVKGLTKEPDTISFQSSNKNMYLQESIYNLQEDNWNGLYNGPLATNLSLATFRVTSGISNPEQFSFISSSGKYLSLNNSLSMKKCVSSSDSISMQKPDSDLTLLLADAKSVQQLLNLP